MSNKKIEDYLPAFKMLVKNRLGPYCIVLKNEQMNKYVSNYPWPLSPIKDKAYDYYLGSYNSKCGVFQDQARVESYGKCKVLLTTSGGDIEISRKNFIPSLIR